ncbi:MAG: cell division protein FtsW [Anaerolineae bacterium]|uniref:FtsW/RodA/SpoVE family cell cycle protein n=1 Tax=Candidatus Flexifilum breve TaxID=3140694 RepID=UPI001AC0A886|nr:cell division protein FtsW [Chloroflexota bacterium]MBN8636915.1 cell division protein FtsW [Anaerolineae bacterium]
MMQDSRTDRRWTFFSTLDVPILVVLVLLLAIGCLMIYSTTFDWSYQDFGSDTVIFMQHARNLIVGLVVFVPLVIIDYRIWKRFAVPILLVTIATLIAVLLFGDGVFGAQRSFLNGSYQPGEVAELTVTIYLAAWLSSKKISQVRSVFGGLFPFAMLLGIIGVLVLLQPDLSTAATIFITAGLMFFLAGANVVHLGSVLALMGVSGWVVSQRLSYAQDRVGSYVQGLTDLTQTNYHAQQAIIAFMNGGWTGRGLGQSLQKFGALPTPHTDSIFAVIGEELGVLGAGFVILLFVVLVIRGLQIARRSTDSFGSLLASGVTLWIITKALLNIAVMLNLVPSTGVALPFISFGGSSLVTVLAGSALVLSVARVSAVQHSPEARLNKGKVNSGARDDRSRGDGGPRVSGNRRRRSPVYPAAER